MKILSFTFSKGVIFMSIKTLAAKAAFKIKANSPQILLVTGIVAGAGALALTIRSTVKAQPVITEAKKKAEEAEKGELKDAKTGKPATKKGIYTKLVWDVTKIYSAPAALAAVSLVSTLKCYGIMNNRLVDATVYGTAMAAKAKNLYKKVAEKYGKEVADELYYGNNVKKEQYKDSETGEIKEKMVPNMEKDMPWYSPYSWMYINESKHPGYDLECIVKMEEERWNRRLDAEDFILLTDVMNSFDKDHHGIEVRGAWCGVGWISKKWIDRLIALGEIDPKDYTGDGYITFNVCNDGQGGPQAKAWREGRTDRVVIDPNVDGPIYKYIDAIRKYKKMSDGRYDKCMNSQEYAAHVCDDDITKRGSDANER